MAYRRLAAPTPKACTDCGAEFPSRTKRHLCDACRPTSRGTIRATASHRFDCPVCGCEFSAKSAAKIYCSTRCKNRVSYNAVVGQAICGHCGKQFGVRRSQRQRANPGTKHFCSRECFAGGISDRMLADFETGKRKYEFPGRRKAQTTG